MKKFAMFAMLLGLTGLGIGCEKSVYEEQKDLDKARRNAAENVREQERDMQDAARKGQENVTEQKQERDEAVREGQKDVEKAKRELEDAKRDEAAKRENREPVPPTTPPNP